MRRMGLQAIYRAPRTSDPHPEQRVYPYLLKGMSINRSNQVWCADITYIPVRRGFLYLVAIMDWASRHVLAWRLSNTLDAGFCVEALAQIRGCLSARALPTASRPGASSTSGLASTTPQGHTRRSMGKPRSRPTAATRLWIMMDKPLRALPTSPQAQQQRQEDLSKEILAV